VTLISARDDLANPGEVLAQVRGGLTSKTAIARYARINDDTVSSGEFTAGAVFDDADDFVSEDGWPGCHPITGIENVKVGSADACVFHGDQSAT
jgi:hypothetical protein